MTATTSPCEIDASARGVHALHHWLQFHGIRARIGELLDTCPATVSAGWVVRCCAEHGFSTRAVQLTEQCVRSLQLPALLPLSDGSAVVLTRVAARHATVEDGFGRRMRWTTLELVARCGGNAVEELPSLRGTRGVARGWLTVLVREHRLALDILATSVLLAFIASVAPGIAAYAVDRALPSGAPALLALFALCITAGALLRGLFGYLRQRALLALDARMQTTALRETFTRLQSRPFAEVCQLSVGEQMQTIDSVERTTQATADVTFAPLLDLMTLLIYVGCVCLIAGALGLIALTLVLVCLVIAGIFAWSSARIERERSELAARALGFLHELISGVAAIKAAGAARACVARWFALLVDERSRALARECADVRTHSVTTATQQLLQLSALGWGGYAVLRGELSLGGLAGAFIYVEGIAYTLANLVQALNRMAQLAPHVERARGMLSHQHTKPAELPLLPETNSALPAVVLEDVWFRYAPDRPWILSGYNLQLQRGEFLTLRGVSGQGKTTILRLIAGLLEPERGSVRIFGNAPCHAGAAFAYLPQDTQLLEGSLLANLTLLSGAPFPQLQAALEQTALNEWTDTLPMKLETVLPPGGGTLSGGQRQWLALTAAVASRRPIVLLDEPTSHIDRARRKQLNLRELFADRTVVMVSHET